jgi:hypothetical protein
MSNVRLWGVKGGLVTMSANDPKRTSDLSALFPPLRGGLGAIPEPPLDCDRKGAEPPVVFKGQKPPFDRFFTVSVFFWQPLTCCGVISITRRASQGFLSRIHDQVAFAIFFGQLQGIERDTHMLSAEAEKTATLSITALT